MSTISPFECTTFDTLFEQLSYLLDRLAELHEIEVAEARHKTTYPSNRPSEFYPTYESSEAPIDALLLSEANSIIPVELQARGDELTNPAGEPSSCITHYMGHIPTSCTLHETMFSLEEFGENAAVARWARLVQQIRRPSVRVAAMNRAIFVSLPVWLVANRMRLMREETSTEDEVGWKVRATVSSVMKNKSNSSWIANVATASLRRPLSRMYIIHPYSKVRTLWLTMCLTLILYDLVIVPIDTFFDIENDNSSNDDGLQIMSLVSCIFWSLDIVANFVTGTYIAGVLVMRPRAIALAYAKSWLVFDVCLILAHWLTTLLRGAGSRAEVQILRGLRFLRLLRVLRLGKLQLALELLLNVPYEGVIVCGAMLKIAFGLMLVIHVLGCVWYGVGRISEDGWARDPAVVSDSKLHKYLLSVHWVASQVHGSSRPMALTTLEHSFADLSLLLGFCLFVFVVANGTLTVLHFSKVDRWKIQAACARFCDSHNISQTLTARIQHYLVLGQRRGGISDQVKEDAELLSACPPTVRADAIDEARWPLLKKLQVFALLENLNARTARALCQDAISVSVVLEQGLVFGSGDPGKSVFIVQFGEFVYHWKRPKRKGKYLLQTISSSWNLDLSDENWRRKLINRHTYPALVWGTYVSEAVLWTKWEHAGDLFATRDSTTLVLSPEIFINTVQDRQDALDFIAFYAQAFVKSLNRDDAATDLFKFVLNEDTMGEIDNLVTNKHLIFLSHYKAEAGTEATLMKESLTKMICDDGNNPAVSFHTPVFLDSANLQDLSLLRTSVSNSDNLVLLLTPGVLTRPWCLVEIVTALNECVRIVPVEVQRPGMSFKYPDEKFYHQLTTGKLLHKEDEHLLRSEGVDLGEVERGLRQVFTQIALPFSPHKSTQVRQAELSDILDRCSGGALFDNPSRHTLF